jgi:hypothetical protein
MKTSVAAPVPSVMTSVPSANSRPRPSRARGERPATWVTRRRTGSAASTAPMTRNVAASASSASLGPPPPERSPPIAGPITKPIPRIDSTSPFARPIKREPASRGTSANSAAPETAIPIPRTNASTHVAASECVNARPAASAAWKMAAATARARVSTRSTSTPTWPAKSASGDQRQISSTATPPPSQSAFARSASAIMATKSPTAETAIAPASSLRSRSRTLTPRLNLARTFAR